MLQNLRGLRKSSEIPRARHAKDGKFGNLFFFAAFAVFARDHPISSFALLALFAVKYSEMPNPFFGCGFAALDSLRLDLSHPS